jgi:hypothetical protein
VVVQLVSKDVLKAPLRDLLELLVAHLVVVVATLVTLVRVVVPTHLPPRQPLLLVMVTC